MSSLKRVSLKTVKTSALCLVVAMFIAVGWSSQALAVGGTCDIIEREIRAADRLKGQALDNWQNVCKEEHTGDDQQTKDCEMYYEIQYYAQGEYLDYLWNELESCYSQ